MRSVIPEIPPSVKAEASEVCGEHSGVKTALLDRVIVDVGLMTRWPLEGSVNGVQCYVYVSDVVPYRSISFHIVPSHVASYLSLSSRRLLGGSRGRKHLSATEDSVVDHVHVVRLDAPL